MARAITHPHKFSQSSLAQDARRISRHLKLYCCRYDSHSGLWDCQERALWWQVFEEAWVETAHIHHDNKTKRALAGHAIDWFRSHDCRYVLGVLHLDYSYVRDVFERWIAYAYPGGAS